MSRRHACFCQKFAGWRWSFLLLQFAIAAAVFFLGRMDANVVHEGGKLDDALGFRVDLFAVSDEPRIGMDLEKMLDAFGIATIKSDHAPTNVVDENLLVHLQTSSGIVQMRVDAALDKQLSVGATFGDAVLGDTRMRSAFWMVERRWAMTKVVRFSASFSSDSWTMRSLSLSRAEVASSKMRIGGFFKKRARWRAAASGRRKA